MHRSLQRSLLTLALCACCFGPAFADQSADLIAKNLAARGGAQKLAAIGSIRFTGKVVEPGDFELTYEETRRRKGGAVLIRSSVEGLTLVQGYDGAMGWRINPFEGRRDAERMSGDETRALAQDATIDGPLLAAAVPGRSVTYLGREDFEGTDAYKLRVTDPGGVEYMVFLDPDSYLEIKIVETRERRGAREVTLAELGDYELVDGVYFPFAIETGALDSAPSDRSKVVIEHATANVDAPDALFTMPVLKATK